MIYTKEIKIHKIKNITSKYIDEELSKLNKDILHWAITEENSEYFILNVSIVEN